MRMPSNMHIHIDRYELKIKIDRYMAVVPKGLSAFELTSSV